MTTTTEQPTLKTQLDGEVAEYRKADAAIESMRETYGSLIITDLENKKEVAAVVEAHRQVKAYRVQISKKGKELRAPATAFGKQVIAEEKRLLGRIQPLEDHLDNQREKLRAAERAAKEAKEKAAAEELQRRVDAMTAVNATINLDMLKAINDEMFSLELKAATEAEVERVGEQQRQKHAADVVDELRKWGDLATAEEILKMDSAAREERMISAKVSYEKQQAEQRKADGERERLQKENADQQKELQRLKQAEAQRVAAERPPVEIPGGMSIESALGYDDSREMQEPVLDGCCDESNRSNISAVHAERLQAMIAPLQGTWDLSPNDVAAIQWALDRIEELELLLEATV